MLRSQRIPLWLKLAYTAFCAVLVPVYWSAYGPTNFLYFCDAALLIALPGLWLENALLLSAPAVGITIPQAIWVLDFIGGLFGAPLTHMTDYMFNPGLALFTRFLSFFHFWLPFLLLWAVARLGYDRRAFAVWTVFALVLLFVCYFLMPAPPPPADNPNLPVNINYVYGLSDDKPQTWLPTDAWFSLLLVGLPVLVFLPTHLVLSRWFGRRSPDPHARLA
ncbi:MAG: hypothetical protein U0793_14375 [Gemmataceae bacterium]